MSDKPGPRLLQSLAESMRRIIGGRHRLRASDGAASRADEEKTARRRVVAPSDWLCGATDVGRVRPHNEDAFYLADDGRTLIVVDGMGGHEAGEVASEIAIRAIADFLLARSPASAGGAGSMERTLIEALEAAQQAVVAGGRNQSTDHRMGCTALVGCICGDDLYTCHAGDVRCYARTADGRFCAITRDHSVVGALVAEGHLTPDEARVHPKKNEVLQAIGMPLGIAPDVNTRTLGQGDRVLLCSDGLWEVLPDEEIRGVIESDGTMRQLATQLLDRANRAGGPDNITVVLYEHRTQRASRALA